MIICRCEEVSLEQLEQAANTGLCTARQLKMQTRATMGACQGRTCRVLFEMWVRSRLGGAPEYDQLPARYPVRPATFGRLAGED